MTDGDLPQGTAGALSFEESVENISHLFEDQATPDHSGGDEGKAEGDEPEADDARLDDPVGGEDAGGSPGQAGDFATFDAKVQLDDGSVVTVAELARNNLFQRDYTRKTTELAAERETFEAQRSKVGQYAQAIAAERDFFLQVAQHFLPAPPDKSLIETEPRAYMAAKEAYEESMRLIAQLQLQQQAEFARNAEETAVRGHGYRQGEAQRLFEAMPELRKPGAYKKFWADAVETMADYGFSEAELNDASDHRLYRAMSDLIRLRRALKRAPDVRGEIEGRPKLFGGGKRQDPKTRISREKQSLAERQRRSGSLEDTIARLESLI
jgi:hypothetical protein